MSYQIYRNKEREVIMKEIYKKAIILGLDHDDLTSTMMDLISADFTFNLRLRDWLGADDFNFSHDWNGIRNSIVRDEYPSKDFGLFVPRFAGLTI